MEQLSDSALIKDPRFFSTILNSLGEAVLITNLEDRILHGNRALEQMTGYLMRDLRQRFAYEVFLDESEWAFMRKQNNQRTTGQDAFYKIQLKTRSGEKIPVRVHATPLLDENDNIIGTIGSMLDVKKEETLQRENAVMRHELTALKGKQNIIGTSPLMQQLQQQIDRVASTDASVLILGESGCGKELVASAIHDRSSRAHQQIVRVNCAAIPQDLFESEFFGHLKGAFTGAIKTRIGRFELADRSTLFLDEVGEIPLDMQGKLLRALQEGTFERIGDDHTRTVNVRIVAATNKDLNQAVRQGHFREDLYYRLNVFPLSVPPLRQRGEDIGLLAQFFIERYARRMGIEAPRLSSQELERLRAYPWPGNVRELENVVERALIVHSTGEAFTFPSLGHDSHSPPSPMTSPTSAPQNISQFRSMEIAMIQQALHRSQGKVHGPHGAANILGIKPTTLASRIKKLGI